MKSGDFALSPGRVDASILFRLHPCLLRLMSFVWCCRTFGIRTHRSFSGIGNTFLAVACEIFYKDGHYWVGIVTH